MAGPFQAHPNTSLYAALTPRTSTVVRPLWLKPPLANLKVFLWMPSPIIFKLTFQNSKKYKANTPTRYWGYRDVFILPVDLYCSFEHL